MSPGFLVFSYIICNLLLLPSVCFFLISDTVIFIFRLKIIQARLQQYMNLELLKLDIEKTEETETKLPTSAGSSRKHESSRKIPNSALLTTPKPLTMRITSWKILKEMGITDHLTCLLKNLHAGHEAKVRTGHGTMDWLQIGKGVQVCILSPCLFNIYADYIMRNAELDETQAWNQDCWGKYQ